MPDHEQTRIGAEPEPLKPAGDDRAEAMRLFEPAPEQIPGQTRLDVDTAPSD